MRSIDLGQLRFVFRGEWAEGVAYIRNDAVTFDNELWVLNTDSVNGVAPDSADTPWVKIGLRGEKGETGESASLRVGSVTTLEAGENPRVTNSGDSHDAVFDFWLPKGAKGDKGDKGDKGERGFQGERGPQGERGETGATGLQGEAGIQGPQGVQGLQGPRGAQGVKGDKGDKGEDGLSFGSFYISEDSNLVLVCFTGTNIETMGINSKGELILNV